jgi:hypothetical protein
MEWILPEVKTILVHYSAFLLGIAGIPNNAKSARNSATSDRKPEELPSRKTAKASRPDDIISHTVERPTQRKPPEIRQGLLLFLLVFRVEQYQEQKI